MTEWTVRVRRPDLTIVGELDDFRSLQTVSRLNAVGSWVLDANADDELAGVLRQESAGVVVLRNGVVHMSGVATQILEEGDGESRRLTVSGADDLVWIDDRLASPQPGTAAPPYNAQAFDVRTAACTTVLHQLVNVNAGPGAVTSRRVPGLTLGADPGYGATLTARARWQPLTQLLRDLATAAGDVGMSCRWVGSGALEFAAFALADRTASVRFSEELGNLGAWRLSRDAPDGTQIVVGGGGEGTARVLVEVADSAAQARWGRRVERFRDRRDSTATVELTETGVEELARVSTRTSISVTPIDIPQQTFGVDYGLGDLVQVVIAGVPYVERVREVSVTVTAAGVEVVPTVGTPSAPSSDFVARMFARLASTNRRITDLERR